jgi:hypothetical protein
LFIIPPWISNQQKNTDILLSRAIYGSFQQSLFSNGTMVSVKNNFEKIFPRRCMLKLLSCDGGHFDSLKTKTPGNFSEGHIRSITTMLQFNHIKKSCQVWF